MARRYDVIERYSPKWYALAGRSLPGACVNLEHDMREILTDDSIKPHITWAVIGEDGDSLVGVALCSVYHIYDAFDPKKNTKVVVTNENVCILEYLCGVRGGGTACMHMMEQWLRNYFDGEEFVIQTCSVFESCSYYKHLGFQLGIYPQIPHVVVTVPDFRISGRISDALYFKGIDSLTTAPEKRQAIEVVAWIQGMNMAGLSLGLSRALACTVAANTAPNGRFTIKKRWYKSLYGGYGMFKRVWGN